MGEKVFDHIIFNLDHFEILNSVNLKTEFVFICVLILIFTIMERVEISLRIDIRKTYTKKFAVVILNFQRNLCRYKTDSNFDFFCIEHNTIFLPRCKNK